MTVRKLILSLCFGGMALSPAIAKVSPEEAGQLGGPVLTGFGAERAGNADGSIPAYTGGLASTPPGIGKVISFMPDPYASEKPLYSIDSKNVDRYADHLAAGTVAMMKKYSTFRVDVYPTHRTAYYPQWILKNILKNAVTAQVTGDVAGDGVTGAYGGIPFPIPKNGYEVMWNDVLKWQGVYTWFRHDPGIFVDSSGHTTLTNVTDVETADYYYDPTKTRLDSQSIELTSVSRIVGPAAQDGTIILLQYPMNFGESDQNTYVYTLGQRRIRLAPEFKYDTPVAAGGGAFNYDEIALWQGRMDKFDFKIIGKKEIIVPYNEYKMNQPSVTEHALFQPLHLNPDFVRWEKHRVWVIDSTLKSDKRHIYSRRTFYIDEDSWAIVASDSYDQAGNLYRVGYDHSFPVYTAPDPFICSNTLTFFDLERGSYIYDGFYGSPFLGSVTGSNTIPNHARFSPETVAGSGIR